MNVPMHVDTDDGWFDLIHELCSSIQKELDTNHPCPGDFGVDQIKEKFGGLRFYVHSSTEKIYKLIDQAESKSYKTCEVCGKKASMMVAGGWYKTICKKCAAEDFKEREKEWVPLKKEKQPGSFRLVSLVKRVSVDEPCNSDEEFTD